MPFYPKSPRNKYNAKKVTIGALKFDSKKEAARYVSLLEQEKRGEISNLELQSPVYLQGQNGPILTATGRKMRLTFDFKYIRDGVEVWEDVKGMRTRDYDVRVAVARAMGINVLET